MWHSVGWIIGGLGAWRAVIVRPDGRVHRILWEFDKDLLAELEIRAWTLACSLGPDYRVVIGHQP